MATSEATIVDAGGRELRVSSPDRVIFPATERTRRGHEARRRRVLPRGRATGSCARSTRRPTTLERWPKGVHAGHRRSRRARRAAATPSSRSASRRGAPDYVETARIEFPSGRHADEICPTEIAVVGWAAQMGTITFHPWPVRARRRRPSRRAAPRPRPAAGHRLRRRRARRRRGARAAGRPRLRRLPEDLRRPRRPHLRADRAALDVHRRPPRRDRVRARARAPPARRGDDEVVEGGARRAHLRRLQPERARPHDRLGLQRPAQAGRAGLGAGGLGRAARRRARGLHGRDDAGALRRGRRPPRGDRRRRPLARSRCSTCTSGRAEGEGDMPYPPDYPKMPGEPKRVQPSRDRDRPRD